MVVTKGGRGRGMVATVEGEEGKGNRSMAMVVMVEVGKRDTIGRAKGTKVWWLGKKGRERDMVATVKGVKERKKQIYGNGGVGGGVLIRW